MAEYPDLSEVFGPLPEQLPAQIGRVMMLCALLEARLDALAAAASTQSIARGGPVVPSESLRRIRLAVTKFEGDLHRLPDDSSTAFWCRRARALVAESGDVFTVRNLVAHGVWAGGPGRLWKLTRGRRPAASTEWAEITLDDLDNTATTTVRLIRATAGLIGSIPIRLT